MIDTTFPNGWSVYIAHENGVYIVHAYPEWVVEADSTLERLRLWMISMDCVDGKYTADQLNEIATRQGNRFVTRQGLGALEFALGVADRPLEPRRHQANRLLDDLISKRR